MLYQSERLWTSSIGTYSPSDPDSDDSEVSSSDSLSDGSWFIGDIGELGWGIAIGTLSPGIEMGALGELTGFAGSTPIEMSELLHS